MSTTVSETMTRHGAPDRMPFENPEVVSAYRHVGIFYLGATVIPWALWLLAGWNSYRPPAQAWAPWLLVVLGMTGLAAPMLLASVLIWREPVLRRDVWGRLFRAARKWKICGAGICTDARKHSVCTGVVVDDRP